MRISFKFHTSYRWDFEFGWNNSMWSSIYWFCIIKVYTEYDEMGREIIEYADMKFHIFRRPKFLRK